MRMPFLQLGLTPEGGATILLPQALGPARAKRVLLLGEAMSAAEAVQTGIWTKIVSESELRSESTATAFSLAQLPADAVSTTKRLMQPRKFAEQFDHESTAFTCQRLIKQQMSGSADSE